MHDATQGGDDDALADRGAGTLDHQRFGSHISVRNPSPGEPINRPVKAIRGEPFGFAQDRPVE
jgi:hypothetical protein